MVCNVGALVVDAVALSFHGRNNLFQSDNCIHKKYTLIVQRTMITFFFFVLFVTVFILFVLNTCQEFSLGPRNFRTSAFFKTFTVTFNYIRIFMRYIDYNVQLVNPETLHSCWTKFYYSKINPKTRHFIHSITTQTQS